MKNKLTYLAGKSIEIFGIWILPAGLLMLYYALFGVYDYNITDNLWDVSFRGVWLKTPESYDPFFYVFISDACIWLYKSNNTVPWFWIFLSALTCGITIQAFFLVFRLLKDAGVKPVIIPFLLVLFFHVLWYDNIISFQITKLVVLCAALSVLILVYTGRDTDFFKNNKSIILFTCLLLLCAILCRYKATLIPLMLVFVFAVLIKTPIKKLILFFAPPIGLLLLLQVYFSLTSKPEIRYGNEIVPYIFSLTEASYIKPFTNQPTAKDTAKVIACMNNFYTDRETITPEYLSSVTSKTVLDIGLIQYKLSVAIFSTVGAFFDMFQCEQQIYTIWLLQIFFNLLLGMSLWFQIKQGLVEKNVFRQFVLLQLFFVFLLAGVTIFIKMEEHFLSPMCLILTLSNLFFVVQNNFVSAVLTKMHAVLLLILATVFLISAIYERRFFNEIKNYESAESNYVNTVWAETDSLFQDKIIVPDGYSFAQLSLNRPFSTPYKLKNNKLLGFDLINSCFYPSHLTHLKNETGSTGIDGFYRYLYSNKERVVMLGEESRMKMIADYLQAIYGVSYRYRVVFPDATFSKTGLGITGCQFHYYEFD